VINHSISLALNAVQEAVFIIDAQRNVIFANTVAMAFFGNQSIGSDFIQTIRHPKCIKAIDETINNGTQTATIISLEAPIKASFKVQVNLITQNATPTETNQILISLQDISDLNEAEKMRTDFVANVSHELRSPLTALAGFIETLRGPAKDDVEARERFLGLMSHEATRMVHMISDLLSLSKVEAQSRFKPTGRANIGDLLTRIKTTLSEQAIKEKKNVNLEILPTTTFVNGNEEELTKVFQNLIENAIKYGGVDSTINIKVDTRKNVAGIDGNALLVEITDQGEGIAKQHIARLTERFYRVDTHRSRDKGGTGLGLAIVKHIINQHRGRLQIKSEVGVGSTFTVTLPMGLETSK